MFIGQDYQKKRIKKHQKFLLKLLHLHIGNYYPLRKWLGISYKGKIDEITHLSIAYNTKYFKKGKKWYKQVTRTYQQPDLGYKLNLVLDKIPQLSFALPALLQPAYGMAALMFFFLTQTTYQPSTKDNRLRENLPDTNQGDNATLVLRSEVGGRYRPILEFDISDIPANAEFTQSDFSMYFRYASAESPTGKTIWVYKLTRTDWVELESTWNIYKTGSNWTNVGGDYVTTNPSGASVTVPADLGWITWDIQNIVEDACGNSDNVELLVRFSVENDNPATYTYFHSNNYTTNTSLRPKLTVTYTAEAAANTTNFFKAF